MVNTTNVLSDPWQYTAEIVRQIAWTNLMFLTINTWSPYQIIVKLPKFTRKLHLI